MQTDYLSEIKNLFALYHPLVNRLSGNAPKKEILVSLMQHMLSPMLPSNLAVVQGYVVDERSISQKIDILIYQTGEQAKVQEELPMLVHARAVVGMLQVEANVENLDQLSPSVLRLSGALEILKKVQDSKFQNPRGNTNKMSHRKAKKYAKDQGNQVVKTLVAPPIFSGILVAKSQNIDPSKALRLIHSLSKQQNDMAIQKVALGQRNMIEFDIPSKFDANEVPTWHYLQFEEPEFGSQSLLAPLYLFNSLMESISGHSAGIFQSQFSFEDHNAEILAKKNLSDTIEREAPIPEAKTYRSNGQKTIIKGSNIYLVNQQDEEGNAPLHKAVKESNAKEVLRLLEANALISIKNKSGDTPLHLAAQLNLPQIASLLIDKGADVNACNYSWHTPVHTAAKYDQDEIIKHLIKAGAEVDFEDQSSFTPIHLCTINGCANSAKTLIDCGANIEILTADGLAPLHLAAEYGHTNMVSLLIEEGAQINRQTDEGNTAMHLAAAQGKVKVIKLLINLQADGHIANNQGETYLKCLDYSQNNSPWT